MDIRVIWYVGPDSGEVPLGCAHCIGSPAKAVTTARAAGCKDWAGWYIKAVLASECPCCGASVHNVYVPCNGCPAWQNGWCVSDVVPADDGTCVLREAVDAEIAAELTGECNG